MRNRKTLRSILFVTVLCMLMSVTALAAGERNLDGTGSITIHMKDVDTGADVPGGAFRYYRVAQPVRVDGNDIWTYTEAFSGCDASLDNLNASDLPGKILQYAKDRSISGQSVTVGSNATLSISNLTAGLYLFEQTTAAEGYSAVNPFLVSVPTNVNGEYVYDVDATPKVEIKKTTTPPPDNPPDVPQTGQLWWPVPILAAAGIFLLILGLRKNRRAAEE